jgi:CheY-like chemotaxis protein
MSDARQTRAAAGTIVTIYLSKGSTMPHTLVLAVGRDAVLLEMRSKVLQAAGYTVIPELSLKKAVAKFREGDFGLVLLCHSIPGQDRERLTRLLREHTSRTPIVSVSASLSALDSFADATLGNDPKELLGGLRELLVKKTATVPDGRRWA